jgi:hypothetical protein
LKIWRGHPGFRRRFGGPPVTTATHSAAPFEPDEREDEADWNDDLKITYRRPGG